MYYIKAFFVGLFVLLCICIPGVALAFLFILHPYLGAGLIVTSCCVLIGDGIIC